MRSTQSRRGSRGFTLVEVMVAMPLVALLMLGSFDLFLMSLRMGSKANAQMVVTQDAANAIQQVVEVGREAYTISLLGNGGAAPTGDSYPDSDFAASLNGQTISTGILVTMPAALQPSDVTGYGGSGLTYITVKNNQGGSLPPTQTTPMPMAPYTNNPSGSEANALVSFLIYRADYRGNPNPAAGACLWEQPLPISPNTPGFPLCRTIARGAPNAVQFVQPAPNEIEVKVVSGAYSAINGTQTDEEGNGTFTSQLDGKCVLMRDYNPFTTPTGGTTSTYNPYQAH